MLPDSVRKYLHAHRREHLERLFELLRIDSIANVPGEENACNRCAQWLADYLNDLGLGAEIIPTAGKPIVFADVHVADDLPTLLIYGHYDVQPPDPLDQWKSDPFEPTIRDEAIYARGASDDKGQLFAHVMAVEAWLKATGHLPLNLKILFEGEEEIGSPNLEPFLVERAGNLAADAAVISDSAFFAREIPSITYSLRGMAYLELTLQGPSEDLHSGIHGGAVTNPLNALAGMIAKMQDERGRVTIPEFYDDVIPLTEAERDEWKKLPFDEKIYASSLGLNLLAGGEKGLDVLERLWSQPTLDCHGITGGYIGVGAKTVIPSRASAKISIRLVPNQDPEKIVAGFERFVAANTPAGVQADLKVHSKARPIMLASDSAAMAAARAALADGFAQPTAMIRCGASIPVTEAFQRLLGLDAVLMGFGLPDDNLHAPNEKLDLDQLWDGSVAAAAFYSRLKK